MTTKIKSGLIADNAIISAHISSGAISSAHLSSIDTDNVSEGSSNLYFTTARARTSLSVTDSGGDGSLAYNNSTGVITYTGPSAAEVRAHISVTDSGGDGSLAYSNGVITYAGPSASEVQAHLSAGTGVTYSSGAISIGQSVATTASPTFADINITGDLNLTGDINSYSVTDLDIVDQTITLGVGQSESASDGSGIVIAGSSASILWDEPNDEFDFNKGINVTGNIAVSGTVDGIDIAARNAVLTSTTTTAGAALPKAGGTMTGGLTSNSNIKTTGRIEVASAQPRILLDRADGSYSWNIYNGDGTGNFPISTFNIANNAGTAVITALDNGNVGIGQTAPNSPLEIVKNITFANSDTFPQLLIRTASGSTGNQLGFGVDEADNLAFIDAIDRGNNVIPLVLQRYGGRVGIGTDSPEEKLHVLGQAVFDNIGNTNRGSIIMGAHGNGTSKWATLAATHYNEATGSGNGSGNAGVMVIGSESAASYNKIWIGHGPYELNPATQINFGTHSATTHNLGGTTRMVIDSSGNVGIGTTNPNGKFHVSGGKAGVISTDASWGQFRVGNTGDAEVGIAYVTGAVESDFLHDTDPGCAYKVIMGINPYGAGTRNFGIGNDTMANYHTTWSEAGHQLPRINNTFDLGSGAQSFRNIHTDNIGVGRGDGPFKKLDVRLSTATAGSHIAAHIGGNNHAAGYAVGLGFDPEGYGYRNKMAIFAEGTGLGYSRGRLHFALRGGSNSDEVAITDSKMCILENGNIGIGPQIDAPAQLLTVATTTNYDPPGLGNSNATFSVLKKDASAGGNYGIITGISTDGNVWSQVQRVDGTATGYNYYLQPSGGSVGIGIPQNHPYIPNLLYPLRVGKTRTGTGNVTDYLSKIAIDGLGYGGSNYQMAALDFTGGDSAGKSGNLYGRIGCSSMVGTNNQEVGSLEFYARAPGFNLTGTGHAMKITGQANTASAGGGTTRNGVLFTYQGLAIDRSWANYPSINVMNSTPYSGAVSTQGELRIHGNNVSSASYPGTSGSDFSCTVRADGGYVTGSDRRRKRNITTIDNALDTVKQLTGKRFQTVNRVEEVQEHTSKNGYKLGFIAQEVEDIIPEAVQYHADEDDGTENWNSSYAMDYGSVVALLVNAIKEQDTVIEDLKSRIETLEE